MDCPYPFEKSQETTSFPGFSPTRPYGASRTEPGNQVFTRKSSLMYTWRKERTAPFFPCRRVFFNVCLWMVQVERICFFPCVIDARTKYNYVFFLERGRVSSASPAWGLLTSWLCIRWGVNVWVDCAASFGMGTDTVAVLVAAAAVSFFQLMDWPSNHVVLRCPRLRF